MTTTRTLVAHCRMRSEGQVERVLERMRHLGFLKNLLAELDEGIHRHNRRAATHGRQPVEGEKLFARIPGHNHGERSGVSGYEAERLVAYPVQQELQQELTRTLEMLRSEHPEEPVVHIPVVELRGAVHDYLGCRKHETKRGRFKSVVACQSIRWTALPRIHVEGRTVRVNGVSLGTIRARLERPLEVGEEIDQVKLVRRQLGNHRVCPSRFELHLTVSVRPPKPKYVRPGPMTDAEREQHRAEQRKARTEARRLANEEKKRQARVRAEREASERGSIVGLDLGARYTAVDDADRKLHVKKRSGHRAKAEARSVSRRERGSRGHKRAVARRRKNERKVICHNRERRMKHAAVVAREHDIIVMDEGDFRAMQTRGGKRERSRNRALRQAAPGEYRAMVEYQAGKHGKLAVRVDPAHTTSQCVECGSRDTKVNATYVRCTACGASTPRHATGGANLAMKWITQVEAQSACTRREKVGRRTSSAIANNGRHSYW